ncbi:hypothetical protein OESDEN_15611 [Oesophagostomum dentatum]|uniref:Uncharacterized protein n=1 Tax=Oesophagostomum dentatum TaxID=61180 RepID=A0A0B1SMF1_OESDE|nr:hypothetical protein OESDEN_15611 [Oesophagostomum dentatum]
MQIIPLLTFCIAVCAKDECFWKSSSAYAGLAKKADKSLVEMVEKHLKTKIKDDTLMFKFVFEQNGAEEVYVAIGGVSISFAKFSCLTFLLICSARYSPQKRILY